jgi:hypothetical protein
MQTFPRLTKLFGQRVDQLDENAVRNAIAAQVPENDELDFKREHHDDPDELAKDVAALANNVGGVLLLGVGDNQGQASHANPVDVSDSKRRHITTVVGSRIHPFVQGVQLRAVPTAQPGHGFLLIIVPRSSEAPHALTTPGTPALRYPVRDGTITRWLGEHELSTRYRDRFQAQSEGESRLDQVHREGLSRIAHWQSPWLAVSVVPIVLGERGVGSQRLAAEMHFTQSVWSPVPTSPLRGAPVRAGRARAILTEQINYAGRSQHPHSELHYNGAGFAATDRDHKLAGDPALIGPGMNPSANAILQDVLEIELLALLWMLGQHAADTGATGELLVRAQQLLLEQTGPARTITPAQMCEPFPVRGDDWSQYQVAHGSFTFHEQTCPVDITVPLDDLVSDEHRAVQVAYDIAADLLGDFGVTEPMILRPDGLLEVQRLHPSRRDPVVGWAQQHRLVAPRT